MITLLLCVGLLTACWLVSVLLLRLGSRLARTPRVSFWRACGAMVVLSMFSTCYLVVNNLFSQEKNLDPVAVALVSLGALLIAEWFVLRAMFRTSFWRAIICWLPLFAGSFVTLPLVRLLVSSYTVPSMSMAPTLLPPHWKAKCEECGREMRVSHRFEHMPDLPVLAVCRECDHHQTIEPTSRVFVPDRFLVNKLMSPRRWDLVVYRRPGNAEERFVHRAVGLPGEEVVIQEGAVWINGKKADVPDDVAEFRYGTFGEAVLGSPEQPARLGPGEYFVIGDFSRQSVDSRTQGPVSAADVEGVVGVIFWPRDRWRLFR